MIHKSLHALHRARLIWLALLLLTGPATVYLFAQENEDCMMCHEDRELTGTLHGRTVSMFVDTSIFAHSVHHSNSCISCHTDAAEEGFPHPDNLREVNCGTCHTMELEENQRGVHGQALLRNDLNAPSCKECHGHHDILHNSNTESRTYKMNIPYLCGRCHKEGEVVARIYDVSEHNIVENYTQGIHGRGLFEAGLVVTATCNDCHGNHLVLPRTSPNSSINTGNIARTCMKCHTRIEEAHKKVIKGELWEKNPSVIPACSSCHPPHIVNVPQIQARVSDKACMKCHQDKNLHKIVGDDTISLYRDNSELPNSVHKNIQCTKCHTEVTDHLERPCSTNQPVDCSSCHAEVFGMYFESGHGQAYYNKKKDAPYCTDCHGTHTTKSKYDDTSPVYRMSIPQLCGECHREDGQANSEDGLQETNALADYSTSVHGMGLTGKGLTVSAVCTDCHTTHMILKYDDERSSIHPANVQATCGTCHKGIYETYQESDHAFRTDPKGTEYPTCVKCHTAHNISLVSQDKFMNEVTHQCGSCHKETADTYMKTYHGKAYQLGYFESARCSDCHGAHNILKAENPASMVSQENLVNTCGKCHVGANKRFTAYLSHATHEDDPKLYGAYIFMTVLLLSVFTFFGIHLLMWLPRSVKERLKKKKEGPKEVGNLYFRRFSKNQRITHIFVIISFIILALTGMMLKFAHMEWAKFLARMLGGVATAGVLHRIGAVITFGYFAFHIFNLVKEKRRKRLSLSKFIFGKDSLWFNKQDIKDFAATIKWFLGRGPRPDYGRWTYWEKFDYLAVFWGVAVIGFSGLVLWFPVFFTRFFPGWLINISQIIHSDEALLAVGFIFTIHFFNTHFRPEAFPMDTVIFTRHMPLEHFKHERPREYQELKEAGKLDQRIFEKEFSKDNMRIIRFFGFMALGIGVILIGLIIYSFLSGGGH
ncbi:MAG: cytochrome c3 family protein [Bacteroidales bacterium]|nr:cytochrome c3 family protein [Bacteroidales bacterium]